MTDIGPNIAILGASEIINVPNWGYLRHYAIFEKYLEAISKCVSPLVVVLPTQLSRLKDTGESLDSLLNNIDGVVLPGGGSNIQCALYGGNVQIGESDEERDSLALNLVSRCISLGIPLLGICRGFQEINVALGGTLNPDLSTNVVSHRSRPEDPIELKYAAAHEVEVTSKGSQFLNIPTGNYSVNSLHRQGIASLSSKLSIAALASDGVIEAATSSNEDECIIGVQWHPEWNFETSDLCAAIWRKFRRAASKRKAYRTML